MSSRYAGVMTRENSQAKVGFRNRIADVLVVDDQPEIVELISEALVDEGYSVRTARNGAEALREILAKPPDLMLLDIAMPIMSGDRLLMQLRGMGFNNLKVVIMTADSAPERFRSLSPTRLLRKPFDLSTLIDSVASSLP